MAAEACGTRTRVIGTTESHQIQVARIPVDRRRRAVGIAAVPRTPEAGIAAVARMEAKIAEGVATVIDNSPGVVSTAGNVRQRHEHLGESDS